MLNVTLGERRPYIDACSGRGVSKGPFIVVYQDVLNSQRPSVITLRKVQESRSPAELLYVVVEIKAVTFVCAWDQSY